MFKKSRRKIVAAIMSVLVLLWTGTLAVIFLASYLEIAERNRGMLQEHAARYGLSQPFNIPPPRQTGSHSGKAPLFGHALLPALHLLYRCHEP